MRERTTADENLDDARTAVNKAIQALAEIIIDECWGHDNYNSEFRTEIDLAFDELRRIKKCLGGVERIS